MKNLKKSAVRIGIILAALPLFYLKLPLAAAAQSPAASDAEFVKKAADGGSFEVMAGELAATKGSDGAAGKTSVKKFGEMMVKDHATANTELKTLAGDKNIKVQDQLSPAMQAKFEQLNTASGADFDNLYAKIMQESHRETVALFQKQAEQGADKDLKNWAKQKLPVLKHHLELAEKLGRRP